VCVCVYESTCIASKLACSIFPLLKYNKKKQKQQNELKAQRFGVWIGLCINMRIWLLHSLCEF